jgi:NAD-dependent DNA ligase
MKKNEKSRMEQILAPTNCPSCEGELKFINELLYCFDKMCPAQWDKKMEHFSSSLKIKGLGPATIKKLEILDYPELYELTVGEITVRLGSEKMAKKLALEIVNSCKVDLQTLLPAFSIPLFGRSASQKLCERITSIEEVTEASCTEAGIGPKATANLMAWLETEFYPNRYNDLLPFSFKSKRVVKRDIIGVVCISGRLKSFPSKAHATKVLENHGYAVKTSLTKDCTHLINESGIESAKTQTARDRGVIIITNLNDLFGE